METTYFALGMLSMLAVIIISVIVVGLFKVMRLEKTVENLRVDSRDSVDSIHRRIDSVSGDFHRNLDSLYSSISKSIEDYSLESKKYTDKRFDKNQK